MHIKKQQWDAKDYAKNSSAQQQWATELIKKLNLCGDESILDIGCGDGKITAQLAAAVPTGSALGIDLSEDMIQLAIEQYAPSICPTLSFLCMNATQIKIPKKVDIAFSNAALHWVKDHTAVLKGIHSSLKPNGKILLQMGGYGNAQGVLDAINEVATDPRWQQYLADFKLPYYFHNVAQYQALLKNCGFKPVRVELIPKDMQHKGSSGLIGWLRTTWFPYTELLPAELRETFLAAICATYTAKHPIDSNGNTNVKMVRLEIEANAI